MCKIYNSSKNLIEMALRVIFIAQGVCIQGVCLKGGSASKGSASRGLCLNGGVDIQGVCLNGGSESRGVCIQGGLPQWGFTSRGICIQGIYTQRGSASRDPGAFWQTPLGLPTWGLGKSPPPQKISGILRNRVNNRAVRILLE